MVYLVYFLPFWVNLFPALVCCTKKKSGNPGSCERTTVLVRVKKPKFNFTRKEKATPSATPPHGATFSLISELYCPGSDPTTAIFNATSSLVRFENKILSSALKKPLV
jgi:hypothetical protein